MVQLPNASRTAIHFKLILVSRCNRCAIVTLSLSPLPRLCNSGSVQLRRFMSAPYIPSGCSGHLDQILLEDGFPAVPALQNESFWILDR